MMPPSASTSRTTVPLATPPMAGLHDIWPIVSSALVTIATRAPARAAATAASVPACPAPTTMTSNSASRCEGARFGLIRKATGDATRQGGADARSRMTTSIFSNLAQRTRIAPADNQLHPWHFQSSRARRRSSFVRRAYEASGLTRATIDERLGLTPDEFRVEGDLVVARADLRRRRRRARRRHRRARASRTSSTSTTSSS